jgi:hypothetical protein
LFVACAAAADPPSILNNTDHIVDAALNDLKVLGIPFSNRSGPSASGPLAVNQTCATGGTSNPCFSGRPETNFLDRAVMIARAGDVTRAEYGAASAEVVMPQVKYQIINQSSSGYALSTYDQASYSALQSSGIVYAMAYCGAPRQDDYPPVAFVTVLPNFGSNPDFSRAGVTPEVQVGSSGCGYQSGIEFSIPWGYAPLSGPNSKTDCNSNLKTTLDTCTPSSTTEAMSAILAALKTHHPNWTWGDVKSVLRSTASNWRTGYTAFNPAGPAFGYGNINYAAANSYTGSIYLQPPGVAVQTRGSYGFVTLYPFVSSRRTGELLFAFERPPVFPAATGNDEYTYTQIAALQRSYGGSLIYNSNGASGVQTCYFHPAKSATVYFVAFTLDNIANPAASRYSRAEGFSTRSAVFTLPET